MGRKKHPFKDITDLKCDGYVPERNDVLNQPIGISNKPLSGTSTIAILENAIKDISNISVYPPVKPNGGEYFLVNRGTDKKHQCK